MAYAKNNTNERKKNIFHYAGSLEYRLVEEKKKIVCEQRMPKNFIERIKANGVNNKTIKFMQQIGMVFRCTLLLPKTYIYKVYAVMSREKIYKYVHRAPP